MALQYSFQLPPFPRGYHLITDQVLAALQDNLSGEFALPQVCPPERELKSASRGGAPRTPSGGQSGGVGILHLFIQHTSAALTINENADPDVRTDFESIFNYIVPENLPFLTHTLEGPDDMPAHIKAAMIGHSVTIPVTNGRLNLGTWQGIYLCEFRNRASGRKIVATIY